ncbi:DNA polymerase III subunit beta [Bradyrhizobium sp. CCGUVB23]|uniref:DNA polymerase III subunit beta n=1 Tax=Bradyrhizobium sp. CCGUVB23 TaxID=2949630 RepID=UPI0020B29EE3|nr:DNA polymerase III subunit beta [Bradyrhizobium sp. CCGUVB23]MCP3464478.1 DNA polymerase III subunit beta [Bradyrhizobium sp. CCGUVB23]
MAGLIKTLSGSLVAALDRAALPVRERESQRIPALGAVRLAANGDCLSVTATSIDGTIRTRLETTAEGDMALPLERLTSLVRHLPADAEITIAADDKGATITSGRSIFRLPVIPLEDLPQMFGLGEITGAIEVEAKIARDLFARPAFAITQEETLYFLRGICLYNTEKNLVGAASDGVRACFITTPAATSLSVDRSLIVHRDLAKVIVRLLANATGKVVLRRTDRLFGLDGASFALTAKLIDATFPDCERVTAGERPNAVLVDRIKLAESLARFKAAADPLVKTQRVTLRWDADGLHLNSHDNVEDLAAETEGEAVTAIQLPHLLDLVGSVRGDCMRLATKNSGSLIAITDPDDASFAAFQSPLRVG